MALDSGFDSGETILLLLRELGMNCVVPLRRKGAGIDRRNACFALPHGTIADVAWTTGKKVEYRYLLEALGHVLRQLRARLTQAIARARGLSATARVGELTMADASDRSRSSTRRLSLPSQYTARRSPEPHCI